MCFTPAGFPERGLRGSLPIFWLGQIAMHRLAQQGCAFVATSSCVVVADGGRYRFLILICVSSHGVRSVGSCTLLLTPLTIHGLLLPKARVTTTLVVPVRIADGPGRAPGGVPRIPGPSGRSRPWRCRSNLRLSPSAGPPPPPPALLL